MRPKRLSLAADEVERYRAMAEEYERQCRARPTVRHEQIAFEVGAKSLSLTPAELRAKDRRDLSDERLKLMAFARIVSFGSSRKNTLPSVGRVFNRTHTTVSYAIHRYGDSIAAALGKQWEVDDAETQ